MERGWQPSDLEDPELIRQGFDFGREVWQTCVEGFEKHNIRHPQPQRITDLARKLIAYYSEFVSETFTTT